MGTRSEFHNYTIAAAEIIPIDLQGARQVVITCQTNNARLYGDAACVDDYLPLDVTMRWPLVVNSNDGYLYLRNEVQGGAANAFISLWVVR